MKVYELITLLSQHTAGAEVLIGLPTRVGGEILQIDEVTNSDPYVFIECEAAAE